MTFHFSLEKVLAVKEQEKNAFEIEYRDAYRDFEKIANMFYEFLKQKETLETRQRDHMAKGTSAQHIQRLQTNRDLIQQKIDQYEGLYQQARETMKQKKDQLVEQSIDVKRFEKLKEVHYDMFRKQEKAEELSKLDEISTMRHVNQ